MGWRLMMKVMVIYESVYGNTAKIAKAIAGAFMGEAQVSEVGAVTYNDLKQCDLFIIGAPTQGGRPTLKTQAFLDSTPENALSGCRAVVFDTRLTAKWVKIFGYAADKIEKNLISKGCKIAAKSEGFLVKGNQGSLKDGEIERAAQWAGTIKSAIQK
jgi:flavodoxin